MCYIVGMYVATVPNRNSPPAILLRESFREHGKVKNRTLANLSHWPAARIEGLRALLRGENLGSAAVPLEQAFAIERSSPHGHVAAVLGTLKRLELDRLLGKDSALRQRAIAMLVARVLEPRSKLATARALNEATHTSTLGQVLELGTVDEDDLYAAMDWLLTRQSEVEAALAKRHLADGSLVLYDVSSTYFEGRCCPLAKLGHSRDGKPERPQIVFGLLTNAEGCPVAVEVFAGNLSDPQTLASQITKVRERFGLQRIVLVGDRGMITQARIDQELASVEGLDWISALRAPTIAGLVESGALQLSLFDRRDLAEISSPEFPGERLIVCKNPLLAQERSRKRTELLAASECALGRIAAATQRAKRALRGKEQIALRVGKVLGRYKMSKHFTLSISDTAFHYARDEASIQREAALDGFYVLRTSVEASRLSAEETVRSYKRLAQVERAFRSLKSVDLHIRPIHHRLAERVRAHVFLCMLAYYVEWHMRERLKPLLFDDEDRAEAEASRPSVVAPARRSARAAAKAAAKRTPDGLPVHSFRTLLADLATLTKNRIRPKLKDAPSFDLLATPTPVQQRAFSLLGTTPLL
jgi:transposase